MARRNASVLRGHLLHEMLNLDLVRALRVVVGCGPDTDGIAWSVENDLPEDLPCEEEPSPSSSPPSS
jgi:hypothetical protein